MALGAVLLASCGAVGQNNRGAADDNTRVRVQNPYGGDIAAEGTPRAGGNLIIGNDREIVSFDPTRQNGNVAAQAIYDLLLRIGPDGEVEPYMAESMDTSDNGLTWRLGLREGVRFSDGTDLNADAVILNVQRHIDKATSPAHATRTRSRRCARWTR
ncbi:hypothetical protein BJF78_10980 [Pseudonocardia sp. CNS-139]|nr:hypothetical protein BJF78_10980 [Pseudonocardia sp. CNS-139]